MATDFNNIYSSLINLKKNLSLTYIIFKVESNLGHHPSRQFSHCMHQSPQWSIEVPGVYYMAYLLMTYRTGRGSGLSSYASIIKVSLLFPSWTYIAFHCKKCFHWSRKLFKKKNSLMWKMQSYSANTTCILLYFSGLYISLFLTNEMHSSPISLF